MTFPIHTGKSKRGPSRARMETFKARGTVKTRELHKQSLAPTELTKRQWGHVERVYKEGIDCGCLICRAADQIGNRDMFQTTMKLLGGSMSSWQCVVCGLSEICAKCKGATYGT